jgi:hypothetical protein
MISKDKQWFYYKDKSLISKGQTNQWPYHPIKRIDEKMRSTN